MFCRKNKSFCREANTSTTCVYSILITVQARLRTCRPPRCQVREATQTLRWPLDCTSTSPPYWSGLLAIDWTWKMPELCDVNFLMISETMSPLELYCRLSSFMWPHIWCHLLRGLTYDDDVTPYVTSYMMSLVSKTRVYNTPPKILNPSSWVD